MLAVYLNKVPPELQEKIPELKTWHKENSLLKIFRCLLSL